MYLFCSYFSPWTHKWTSGLSAISSGSKPQIWTWSSNLTPGEHDFWICSESSDSRALIVLVKIFASTECCFRVLKEETPPVLLDEFWWSNLASNASSSLKGIQKRTNPLDRFRWKPTRLLVEILKCKTLVKKICIYIYMYNVQNFNIDFIFWVSGMLNSVIFMEFVWKDLNFVLRNEYSYLCRLSLWFILFEFY